MDQSAVRSGRCPRGRGYRGGRLDAYRQAARALSTAQAALTTSRNTLNLTIGQYLSSTNPASDATRLDGLHPIVLFPVRIETRYSTEQSALLIRVYPDEILGDSFEPELTADELACGQQYWAEANGSVGPNEAWRHIIATYPCQRAAWIVLQTDPANPPTPPAPLRTTSWTQPAMAPLLPDRWIAVAYRNGVQIAQASSQPVLEPLQLTISPDTSPASLIDISGALNLGVNYDPGVLWTVDYTTAVNAGMAFSMPLSSTDWSAGIDRLIVIGVKSTIAPDNAATALRSLIDAHHYTRGIAFVPQGTPAHDSRDVPSGYPPPDPNGATSFAVERGPSLATPDGDGILWSRALGLADDTVAHIAGADRTEQASAAAMNRALFPATWGYFLETMMAPIVSMNTVDATYEYFATNVRARGHFPAFRIGNVPYGLLPVSSFSLWRASDTKQTPLTGLLPGILRAAQPFWSAQINAAPHLGRSANGEGDVLDAMSMEASAQSLRFRRMLGTETLANLVGMLGIDWALVTLFGDMTAANLLRTMGWSGTNPRALSNVFAAGALPFRFPFVASPLSETDPLSPNYITWVRTASVDDLKATATPFTTPSVLLFRLLTYAALTECWREGRRILLTASAANATDLTVHELNGIVTGTETRPTPWDYLGAPVPSVTHTMTLGHFLSPIRPGEAARTLPPAITDYRDSLAVLETLPTAELDRLCTETLDLASNRLDAWISSLYAERLDTMRATTPTGTHVGAYGWVESLKPSADKTVRLRDGRSVLDSTGGFIQAPSMAHAAAAAVLRNAYLTYTGGSDGSPYAVDLSSARVRAARFVLEAVMQGQQVGAVFGYQIESGLHAAAADQVIDLLRNLYPLVANKTVDSGQPAEAIAARNVVDGLALRTAWKANTIPWGTAGLPTASGTLYDAVVAQLGALDRTVDAVADTLLADSVYQLVQGSTMGASGEPRHDGARRATARSRRHRSGDRRCRRHALRRDRHWRSSRGHWCRLARREHAARVRRAAARCVGGRSARRPEQRALHGARHGQLELSAGRHGSHGDARPAEGAAHRHAVARHSGHGPSCRVRARFDAALRPRWATRLSVERSLSFMRDPAWIDRRCARSPNFSRRRRQSNASLAALGRSHGRTSCGRPMYRQRPPARWPLSRQRAERRRPWLGWPRSRRSSTPRLRQPHLRTRRCWRRYAPRPITVSPARIRCRARSERGRH